MERTVLIVDDHAGFRTSVRRLLEADGFRVVGEAQDGAGGIQTARELRPDLVLLDIQLPDIDGFEVCAELRQSDRAPAVVLTSTRSSADFGSLVADSGALGFLPKAELSGAALEAFFR
jgi:DNA-binding NarL/FixJ family response regulator